MRGRALYLILSGTADVLHEHPGGRLTRVRRMQAGDFFGELGLVAGQDTAHVVARDSLTCLVLSRTPITPHAGRGAGATSTAEPLAAVMRPGTCTVDVTSYLHRKLGALARHRTQYPIVPSMLPRACCTACSAPSFPPHRRQQREHRRRPLGQGTAFSAAGRPPGATEPPAASCPWHSLTQPFLMSRNLPPMSPTPGQKVTRD